MTSSDDAVRLPVEPGILPQTSSLGLSLRSSALECGNPSPDDQASTSTSDDMALASEISKINLNPSLPTENCRDENAEQKMNEHRIGTKHGTSGVVVSLRANYIKLEETKLQSLVEYRLDIVPPVDSRAMRMKIWRGVRGSLGPNYKLYDGGNKVITLTELELNSDAKRELHATVNETIHKVVIKQTRVIPKGSIDALAIYGVLLKRSMQSVNLQPVGSAKDNQFIDKSRLRAFEQHMTEMAPGFINVVQQREDALMLRIFPFHKFFRTDTCYDQMVRIKGTLKDEEEHHFEQRVRTLLCGNVVMTRYNHKTYRVDDVDFTKNPTSVWNEETRETYVGYYKRKYDLEIKNLTQPLLISRAKARDRRRGVEFLRLIPEVCNMTGISEQMKKDFRTMHDVSSTLKRNPEQMRKEVRDLLEKLRENPSVQEDFKTFNG
ncbi:unnamed protein product [Notodromas monacha]|uniref:PAZ domain-containing protein n=1 Tax=Notodromas monacha TaxID=399045 RepID=A0A7R9GJT5_9CRUS|nr:unnamed protein product [Notodromas monacha]CAG0925319.1 unnamed protein product [Notodromas monacha]